ncbi:ArsR family transcriptional regulator [Methanobacterium aggregans]|uniref:ArsR family transcriptional regulator n=1 Tax=Methanobacterium aggregans TaxID=1615586 RepID=UPI001AE73F8B|nr:ArsR family transcriptional regulator [Methanobacterium aggregans]MBP2046313.1 biotin operon repressor [Methanobacterium aggregans]
MKTLITNLNGHCLFNASRKTQTEGLIILHEGKYRKTDLEDFLKGGDIKIETEDPYEACRRIEEIIKGTKKHGRVFVAYNGRNLGPLLNFVANKVGVDGIFTCYNDKVVRLPLLKLDISGTKLKILNILYLKDLTARELGEEVKISRAMVYKHLKGLMELGLVKKSDSLEKYSITNAGKLSIS